MSDVRTALDVHFVTNFQRTVTTTNTRSIQPCIPPGSLNRVPASAGVRAGMSPLPGDITLCDPTWHVSSRSGVATLWTAIHLLPAYLLTYSIQEWALNRALVPGLRVGRYTGQVRRRPCLSRSWQAARTACRNPSRTCTQSARTTPPSNREFRALAENIWRQHQ